jgi:hypothetical protein
MMTLKILGMSMALGMPLSMLGWAQTDQPSAASQAQQNPPAAEVPPIRTFPLDVAGYVSFRYLNDDALQDHSFYREYSASLFLSKTVGRWRFHTEFNGTTAPEYDSDGIHLFPPRPSLSVKLDSGFVNFNARDWLQIQAGMLFIPTYWRTHRYQSTTLSVDEPLIDQNIFPTALKGGAVYGDKYWKDGGLSYIVYGGVDLQSQYQERTGDSETEQSRVVGGKLTFHVPNRTFFRTLDIAFHRLHRFGGDDKPDDIYGAELQLSKGRFEVLGEFDHASLDFVHGLRTYFRQGYYVQPSIRITPRLFATARYDRLDRDSRYADQKNLAAESAGVVFRPVPKISIKVEGNRYEPQGSAAPAYYGATTSLVWFFHLP